MLLDAIEAFPVTRARKFSSKWLLVLRSYRPRGAPEERLPGPWAHKPRLGMGAKS